MFWGEVLKLKKEKYLIMKNMKSLQDDYWKYELQNDEQSKYMCEEIKNTFKVSFDRIDEIEREINELEYRKFLDQTTFMYCVCGNELSKGSCEMYTKEDGSIIYSCDKCHALTTWRFDIGPAPICIDKIYHTMDEYTKKEKAKEFTPVNIDKKIEEYKKSVDNDLYSQLNISDEVKDKYDEEDI